MEKRDLDVVSLSITNKVGASLEKSEIKGISHFIEHLVFMGTEKRSHEDISREIEKRGGILNAFTADQVTSFWFKLPSEHVFSGLDILIDMLKNPRFDPEKFEKEKKVILEEIKMYHDTPSRDIFDKIKANLYKSPFGEPVIGFKESVSKLDRDFVISYFKKVYNPSNYIVTIVGNCDFEKICRYIEKNFDGSGKVEVEFKVERINKESVEERQGLDQAHFVFAIHAPLPGEKEHYAMQVLDAYLANGMSSKIFLEVREKRGLAYAVKSMIECEKNYSHYIIYVGTMKDKVDEVKRIIIEEFEKVVNMSENELEEAKQQLIGLKRISAEESANVMNELMMHELVGDVEDYYKFEEKIKRVKLEDIKKLAADSIKNYSTAAIVPK